MECQLDKRPESWVVSPRYIEAVVLFISRVSILIAPTAVAGTQLPTSTSRHSLHPRLVYRFPWNLRQTYSPVLISQLLGLPISSRPRLQSSFPVQPVSVGQSVHKVQMREWIFPSSSVPFSLSLPRSLFLANCDLFSVGNSACLEQSIGHLLSLPDSGDRGPAFFCCILFPFRSSLPQGHCIGIMSSSLLDSAMEMQPVRSIPRIDLPRPEKGDRSEALKQGTEMHVQRKKNRTKERRDYDRAESWNEVEWVRDGSTRSTDRFDIAQAVVLVAHRLELWGFPVSKIKRTDWSHRDWVKVFFVYSFTMDG